MKHYLKNSLLLLVPLTIFGTLLYNNGTSVAHASSDVNLPIPPLEQLADSLRIVSYDMQTMIDTLASTDSSFYASLAVPVESQALCQAIDSTHNVMQTELLRTDDNRPDAFLLSNRIGQQQQIIDNLKNRIQAAQELREHLPTLIPCNGQRSSGFGVRVHPIFHREKMHTGIDLSAPKGTPIYSAGAGVVVFAGWKNGYGNVVELDHGFGYRTLYGHSSKLLVKAGDTVGRGSIIALVGSTGNSTGCHLHYETIIDDQKMNPEPFLLDASLASVKLSEQE
jgi:murein DD-endopeptidase MepM/ murein hydrolase activator NlpD